MSKVPTPESAAVSTKLEPRDVGEWAFDAPLSLEPTTEELAVLSSFERLSFRLVRRMNVGKWKRFWTWCQKTLGAGWIHLSTYNIMNVYGLENVEAASHDRPLLLVANHRSFFDMYTFRVLTELARVGPGNIIGFHPEGTRNKSDDPYSFLPAQPGVGKLILASRPQVIPVFIAGLCNDLPRQ